jgi:hypothetical protein
MISIIISSINEKLLSDVCSNIAETIGVPFEIISVENRSGNKSICEVYNEGIEKANFSILCFMHEDVEIHTHSWGSLIVDCFYNNPDVGLIGVVGSTYKTLTPSGWHNEGILTHYGNLIQHYKFSDQEDIHYFRNPDNVIQKQVAVIDGVWFCTTKGIAQEFRFDDVTFKGFHAYDIDFSLSIGQRYKVVVTYQLLFTHFSEGSFNLIWLDDILKLHKKWNSYLPICTENLTFAQISRIEKVTFKQLVTQCINLRANVDIPLFFLFSNWRFFKKFPNLFASLAFFVVKQKLLKHS